MAWIAASHPWVAIVVINWCGAEDTSQLLHSLEATAGIAWKAYVVDNGSEDDSVARISADHPGVTPVRSPRNLGYAGGFNLGCRRALSDEPDYIWLLNNDVTVEPETLGFLLEADSRVGPALLAPKILVNDRPWELWHAGTTLDWQLKGHHVGRGEPDDGRYDVLRRLPWASGCSLLFRTSVLQCVGPMEETYFLYLEDLDWCLQARRLGFPIYYVPTARIYHKVSHSVDTLDRRLLVYYSWRNYYLLVHLRGCWWQRLYAYSDVAWRLVKTGLRYAVFASCRNDSLYHARTRALMDFVLGRFGEATFTQCRQLGVQRQNGVTP